MFLVLRWVVVVLGGLLSGVFWFACSFRRVLRLLPILCLLLGMGGLLWGRVLFGLLVSTDLDYDVFWFVCC